MPEHWGCRPNACVRVCMRARVVLAEPPRVGARSRVAVPRLAACRTTPAAGGRAAVAACVIVVACSHAVVMLQLAMQRLAGRAVVIVVCVVWRALG